MTGINRISNVYQFPAPIAPEPPRRVSAWAKVSGRVRRSWWRLRITIAEIRWVLRRQHGSLDGIEPVRFGERDFDTAVSRPRLLGPARIIDFDAARLRLRPVGAVGPPK
jgi:hypothetical protein